MIDACAKCSEGPFSGKGGERKTGYTCTGRLFGTSENQNNKGGLIRGGSRKQHSTQFNCLRYCGASTRVQRLTAKKYPARTLVNYLFRAGASWGRGGGGLVELAWQPLPALGISAQDRERLLLRLRRPFCKLSYNVGIMPTLPHAQPIIGS